MVKHSNDNNKATDRQLVTKQQIALRLNCCLRTVDEYVKNRTLPYYKIGRLVRFDLAEVDEAIKKFRQDKRRKPKDTKRDDLIAAIDKARKALENNNP